MKTIDKNLLKNEKGMALVLAMVMLVLLTLIGFAAVNNSASEIALSGNYRLAADSFYVAEAGLNSAMANDLIFTSTTTGVFSTTSVTVGNKTATLSSTFLQSTTVPPGSGTGVNTAGSANLYLVTSTGMSWTGTSKQQAVAAKLIPAS